MPQTVVMKGVVMITATVINSTALNLSLTRNANQDRQFPNERTQKVT